MVKHYITKYQKDGKQYATSWMQINIFRKCFCFFIRTIKI